MDQLQNAIFIEAEQRKTRRDHAWKTKYAQELEQVQHYRETVSKGEFKTLYNSSTSQFLKERSEKTPRVRYGPETLTSMALGKGCRNVAPVSSPFARKALISTPNCEEVFRTYLSEVNIVYDPKREGYRIDRSPSPKRGETATQRRLRLGAFTPTRGVFQSMDDLEEEVEVRQQTVQQYQQQLANADGEVAVADVSQPATPPAAAVTNAEPMMVSSERRSSMPEIQLKFDLVERGPDDPEAGREVAIQVNGVNRLDLDRPGSLDDPVPRTQRSRVTATSHNSSHSRQMPLLTQRSRLSSASRLSNASRLSKTSKTSKVSQSQANPTEQTHVPKPAVKPDVFATKPGPFRLALPLQPTPTQHLLQVIAATPSTAHRNSKPPAALTPTPTSSQRPLSGARSRSVPPARPGAERTETQPALLLPPPSRFGRRAMLSKTLYSTDPLVLSHKVTE